jgi:hypothetical protein
VTVLFHFSENPSIEVFVPHVAPTSTDTKPFVWAVDETHAPSYWFPCPRVCCWTVRTNLLDGHAALLGLGAARRMHAIEAGWVARFRECKLFAYQFDTSTFDLKLGDAGYWVSQQDVRPQKWRAKECSTFNFLIGNRQTTVCDPSPKEVNRGGRCGQPWPSKSILPHWSECSNSNASAGVALTKRLAIG